MDPGVQNKVFMVAGASSGLGYAIARKLAEEGAKVSIASRSQESIATAAATISEETAAEIRGYVFDARDGDSITQWVEDTQNDFGHIDGLVINALNMFLAQRSDTSPGKVRRAAESAIPMGRYGQPEEFANAAHSCFPMPPVTLPEPIRWWMAEK